MNVHCLSYGVPSSPCNVPLLPGRSGNVICVVRFIGFSRKGVLLMATIPQTDCCLMLGIDPKTLRNWLNRSNMQFAAHPTDARIKSLTLQQVQQLATLHARPLPSSAFAVPTLLEDSPQLRPFEGQTLPKQTSASLLVQAPTSFSPPLSEEAELKKSLCCLETKVTTLQEQLAQLAMELLHERSQRYERRLSDLETLLRQTLGASACLQELPAMVAAGQPEGAIAPGRRLHPAELRARSRVLPLIEYGAAGTYVVICPKEGDLQFTPDSPAWFDWLASLSSFRFVGKLGRFTAYRKCSTSRSWSAYRTIHQHDYKHYLGTTDHLTLDCLEQMATKLQSYME